MQKTFRTHAAAEKGVQRVKDAAAKIRARQGEIPLADGGEGFELETLTIFNDRIVVVHCDEDHIDEIRAALIA